jgi:peptide deformylase
VGDESIEMANQSKPSKVPSRSASDFQCPVRREGRTCAPLNQVLINDVESGMVQAYASCSCGRRYPLTGSSVRSLATKLRINVSIVKAYSSVQARALDQLILDGKWPIGHVGRYSKKGVVPIGVPVLHNPTRIVSVITPALKDFSAHMIEVMNQAAGIGLAANQAGVGLRMLVHNMRGVAPQVLINPELLQSSGLWNYTEGCLSLKLEGTAAIVTRPKRITVRAATIDGKIILANADELFARVLQHEIDHLDGIEYVQRLDGQNRTDIYKIIEHEGIAVSCIPPFPYKTLT